MNFCSHCGGPVVLQVPEDDERPRHVCPSCGTIHYQNPKLVVGCIPVWEDRILMCRRNIEPRKGYWTLPAGFLENGETAAAGARRETLEETASTVTDLEPYLMVDIVHIHQIYLMFRSRLLAPDFHPTRESSEVKLLGEADIPWNDIAFKVVEKTLRHYLQDRPSGRFVFRTDKIDNRRLIGS
ncbi:ADP-ribose pyrophosphatase [Desulfosarcina alkanivorans]|uniref:ADP-ribose pyrophosphatase n=1 Tax=Desulfosarcina alkanivorans TaxID=571177 RepID=A0A5K7YKX6_9BACT|nr:NUDIX hydrolase [Desulfosarcina alkanivorans]BBO69478.1 ADP-ribose pyrophosphatase [Desulfosarcina alkanivorans]